MPGQDDLIRIIDAPATISQLNEVMAQVTKFQDQIRTFVGISLFSKNTDGMADFRAQETQITNGLNQIKAMQVEMDNLKTTHAARNKARTDEEIAQSQRQAQATRERVRDIRAEEDAYKNLTNEYAKHAQAVKVAAAQYGVHSKEAKAATEALKPFAEQLHKVNKAADDGRSFVGRYTEQVKEGFKEIGSQISQMIGAFYIIEKTFDFIKDSVKEFMAAEASTARLKNILSNMGREDVFNELNKDAKELSETLGTVSQKDVTETFQKLVTYGKLTKNQILELTPVIADFAAKQRIDMPEATAVITKALEGNSRGLKEYGINVKDGKDAAERFGIIMTQLAPKVAGATQAQGDLAVQSKKTEVAIEELKVKIGEEFAPAVSKLWQAILEGINGLPQMLSSIGNFFHGYVDLAKEAAAGIKFYMGDASALVELNAEKMKAQKILEDSRLLQNARESAEAFRKVAAKESLTDQQKHLKEQIAIARMDQQEYEMMKKKGELGSENGKQATERLVRSLAIIKALKEQFESSKDNRVLGNGNPDDDGKKDKGAKDPVDYAQEIAIQQQKAIADSKDATIKARMDAYNLLTELQSKEKRNDKQKYDDDIENIHRLSKIKYDAANSDNELAAQQMKDFEAADKKRLDDKVKREKDASDATLKAWEDGRIKQKKIDDDHDKMIADHKANAARLEKQAAEEVFKLGVSLVQDAFEKQINALQKQIDKNNELKEVETRNIQSSTLSQQEKAAAQINLDAKVAAQNEALARRQREMKQKEAIADRAATIVKIAEETAIAIASALKDGLIVGEAEAIAIGVIGAAQIAAVLAKPIPQYKEGTKNHPGGPMILHPGEMRIDPDGQVSMTPNAPATLTYGERGTKIITANEVNQGMLNDIMKMQARQDKESKTDEYLQAILAATQNQTAAMKKKQPIHNHIHIHSSFQSHIDREVRNV